MERLGFPELLVILLIVLFLFGAGRIPEVFRSLGSGIREFKKALREDEPSPPTPQPKNSLPLPAADKKLDK